MKQFKCPLKIMPHVKRLNREDGKLLFGLFIIQTSLGKMFICKHMLQKSDQDFKMLRMKQPGIAKKIIYMMAVKE